MTKLTASQFWEIKHQIDDEVARLGWSKAKCKSHIKTVYGASSRLSMTDEQLFDLLAYLRNLSATQIVPSLSRPTRREKRRRRRI